ncbi:peptide transport system permease protein sapB [Klebsiella pneumoniae]|nr:peptide transport system permease protein sapB [Klebsiella pneumoniae]
MVIGALVIIVNVISDILGAMANPLKHKEMVCPTIAATK